MKSEELGFFNRQLAGMLRSGVPLEGALKKLCESMPSTRMRDSLLALEKDLSTGCPLAEALNKHDLPELYKRILTAGVAGGDLPGTLILFADYCVVRDTLSRRLRGLLTYPLIALTIALGVSIFMTYFFHVLAGSYHEGFSGLFVRRAGVSAGYLLALWLVPLAIFLLWLLTLFVAFVPQVRRRWQWFVPGLRETCLAQIASLIHMQLQSGVALQDALKTTEALEQGTPVAMELSAWREHLAKGGGSVPANPLKNKSIPPLFRWLVRQSGEDLVGGFAQTASYYQERSSYRGELFLYAVLPISVFLIGFVILCQFLPIFGLLGRAMHYLTSFD